MRPQRPGVDVLRPERSSETDVDYCFLFVSTTCQENITPGSDGKGDGEDVAARRGKSQSNVQNDQRRNLDRYHEQSDPST